MLIMVDDCEVGVGGAERPASVPVNGAGLDPTAGRSIRLRIGTRYLPQTWL